MLLLRTFGGLSLVRNGIPVAGAGAQRARLGLLAVLAVAGDRGVPRDRLLALFWPESDTERARGALKQALYAIRKDLGEVVIGTDDLRLDPAHIETDVGRFEAALADGRLEAAVDAWSGPFLEGIHLRRSNELDGWIERERLRLGRLHGEALETLAAVYTEAGDPRAAVGWWRRRSEADPLSARVTLRLMDALTAAGDRETAIREGEACAVRIRAELEIQPDATLLDAIEALRSGLPEAHREAPPTLRARAAESRGDIGSRISGEASTIEPADPPGADVRLDPPRTHGSPGRRRRLALLPAALIAVFAVAGAMLARSRTAGDPSEPTVAILPFAVEGDAASAYLGDAMVELLTAGIDGSQHLRGADPRAVIAAARERGGPLDAASAARIAARVDAAMFVLGTVVSHGGELRTSASLFDRRHPDRELARAAMVGAASDPFAVADGLAGQLLAARSPAGQRTLSQTAALTTRLPAFTAFLEAEDALRAGNMQRAVAEYTRAIHEDSTFALAYLRLATFAGFNEIGLRPDTLLRHAKRFEHTLPTRYRSAVDALLAAETGDPDADHKLSMHVQHYPDDADGWYALGERLLHANPPRGQPLSDAEQAIDRTISLDSAHGPARIHHFELKMRAGRYDEAARDLRFNPPGTRLEVTWWVIDRIAHGGPDWTEEVVARLRTLDPNLRRLGLIYAASLTDYTRPVSGLWRWHLDNVSAPDMRRNGMQALVWMDVVNGDPTRAWTDLRALEQEDPDGRLHIRILLSVLPFVPADPAELATTLTRYDAWDAIERRADTRRARDFMSAIIHDRMGDARAADARLARLRSAEGDSVGDALGLELATVLDAWLAANRGDLDEARARIAGFEPGPPRPGAGDARIVECFLLAETLERTGDAFNARRWYRALLEDYTTFKTIAFRVPALLGEARTLEALGNPGEARARYERVIRLRGDVDAELQPQVEEARAALRRLR